MKHLILSAFLSLVLIVHVAAQGASNKNEITVVGMEQFEGTPVVHLKYSFKDQNAISAVWRSSDLVTWVRLDRGNNPDCLQAYLGNDDYYHMLVKAKSSDYFRLNPFIPENFTFSRDLNIGESSIQVANLQAFLQRLGYMGFGPDDHRGYFDTVTADALRAYQVALGITSDYGYFGPVTRAWVNMVLKNPNWWTW